MTVVMRGIVLVCLNAIISPVLRGQSSKNDEPAKSICLGTLLSKPGDFNGQRVRVAGYLTLGWENFALYPSAESAKTLKDGALWVSFAPEAGLDKEQIDTLNRKYVILEGSLNASEHGHMEGFTAEVQHVSKVELLSGEMEAVIRKECHWTPEVKP